MRQLDLFGGPPRLDTSSDEALAKKRPAHVRLGTSSWTFPGWAGIVWAGSPTQDELVQDGLAEYARHPLFTTVGIDRSFYNPLTESELSRYKAQLPPGFLCVSKAWSAITTPYDQRRGQVNPLFLDAEAFVARQLDPIRRVFLAHAGPVVLQFPPLSPRELPDPEIFAHKLDAFFGKLPRELTYAVELRNPELLHPGYLRVLRAWNVGHVLNHWERMPSIRAQLSVPGVLTAPHVVCRLMLPHGVGYEDAREAFAPFDRIRAPDPAMREDVVRLARRCAQEGLTLFVIVNNKAEGSSPLTVRALLELLAD